MVEVSVYLLAVLAFFTLVTWVSQAYMRKDIKKILDWVDLVKVYGSEAPPATEYRVTPTNVEVHYHQPLTPEERIQELNWFMRYGTRAGRD